MTGVQVARFARSWVGTPWCHGASCKGAGADCLGLVRGVWRDILGRDPVGVPPYREDWAETGEAMALVDALQHHLKPAETEGVGDVLLFRLSARGPAKHLGLQTACGAAPRFVHACSGHGVVEVALSAPWGRRLVSRFTLPIDGVD
ncbi:MAG: peptidase [Alkalilacustris sp.]